jgi:hypothetical protein
LNALGSGASILVEEAIQGVLAAIDLNYGPVDRMQGQQDEQIGNFVDLCDAAQMD